MHPIFTIGYAGFTIIEFIDVLQKYNISCVIDVRSVAASRFYPAYNKDSLEKTLKAEGVYYRNYSVEFGARQTNKEYYSEQGYLDFRKFVKSGPFIGGVEKINTGMKEGYVFTLMCAEKDPIRCHRSIMVASELYRRGFDIRNIMPDGILQTQKEIENRLLEMYFPAQNQLSLFEDAADDEKLILQAYEKRNAEIGFKIKE